MNKLSICRADAADIYHRSFKWIAVPCIAAYAFHAITHNSQQVVRNETAAGGFVSVSGAEGLRMSLSAPMPQWMLTAHGRGALMLCGLVFAQKEIVRLMASDYTSYVQTQRWIGFATLGTLFVFNTSGYLMCAYSTFANFEIFAVLFALPFACWLVGIYATARLGYWRAHAFLSNMLLKGCIATPLSRVGGAMLQRRGWDLASGYYQGIFGVALVIAVWQAVDFVNLLREPVSVRRVEGRRGSDR